MYTLYITATLKTKRTTKYKRKRSGYSGQPFSVLLLDAAFGNAFTILSAVYIACKFCTPYVQCAFKCGAFTKRSSHLHAVHRRNNFRYRRFRYLLPLLLFSRSSSVYAIHGTNHAFIQGASSSGRYRQQKHVSTIIANLKEQTTSAPIDTSNTPASIGANATASTDANTHLPSSSIPSERDGLRQEPYCFIVNCDSIAFVIDIRANEITVNDAKIAYDLTPTNAKVKGVDRQCTQISGKCKINLPVQSDNGEMDLSSDLRAVFIPSCPYNIHLHKC